MFDLGRTLLAVAAWGAGWPPSASAAETAWL
jgi:hypothetical protein